MTLPSKDYEHSSLLLSSKLLHELRSLHRKEFLGEILCFFGTILLLGLIIGVGVWEAGR